MEAKDTILKASKCLERSYDWDTDGGYKEEAVDNLLLEQAEISFKAGQEREKAKVWATYKNANDLKELEDLIKEYLLEKE